MQQRHHAIDMRPAKAHGMSLFAANDPKAEQPVRVDPKCDRADQRAFELQLRMQQVAEVQGRA